MVNTRSVSRNGSNCAENLFGDYLYTLVNKHIRLMAGKFYTVLEDDDIIEREGYTNSASDTNRRNRVFPQLHLTSGRVPAAFHKVVHSVR